MRNTTVLQAVSVGRWRRLLPVVKAWSATEADRRFLWAPVLLAAGLLIYYSMMVEPSALMTGLCLAVVLVLGAAFARIGQATIALAAVLVALGFSLGKVRTASLMTPVLQKDTGVVTVSGWVESVEIRSEKRQRILLYVTELEPGEVAPKRLRVNLPRSHGDLAVGTAVSFKARLFAPNRPVSPGAFDFARRNWFLGIGGSGFGFGEISILDQPEGRPLGWTALATVSGIRNTIAAAVESVLTGNVSAYSVAVLTGMRDRLPQDVVDNLRAAGLAHLLAISGLHMGLVAYTLFRLVRGILALFPLIALRYPIKKWAAGIALIGGAGYLIVSGAAVSTQRAYIMIAIMFLAIIVERPAISMRNVAIAALFILLMRPESVLSAGFQMSFLAVTGLVALYESRERLGAGVWAGAGGPVARWGRTSLTYFGAVVLTTIVAGLATAPMAAYHFHKVAVLGAVANLVAIPLMALLIMPLALIGVLLMPLGLEAWPLQVAGFGISLLLDVAEWAAGIPGAMRHVPSMGAPAFVLIVAGLLWLCLWRSPMRLGGVGIVVSGIALGALEPRPDVLIEEQAKVVAVRTHDGQLVLSDRKKARFVSERWLAMDGDPAALADAAARAGMKCDTQGCAVVGRNGLRVALVLMPAALWDDCRTADIVITAFSHRGACGEARVVIDRYALYKHGAHALYFDGDEIVVRRVADERGTRPWARPDESER